MFIGKRDEFLALNNSIQTEFAHSEACAARNSWRPLVCSNAEGFGVEDLILFLVESVRAHVGPGTEFYDLAAESVRVRHKQLSSGFDLLERDTIAPAGKALLLAAASALGEATEIAKQALLLDLINNPNEKAYDGIPFFGTGHFVNYKDASQGTYDNAETGKDLTADNLAAAIATIEDRRMPDGTPRMLKAKCLLHAPALKKKAHDATGVQISSGYETRSTFGVLPVCVPGLAKVGGKDVWIVTAELATGGSPLSRPFGISTLIPPQITDYSGVTIPHLERAQSVTYILAGDLTAYLGHPYLAHRCAVA